MLTDTVPLQVEFEEAGVGPQQISQLDDTTARHVVTTEVESLDAQTPGDALEEDVDGVAGEAAVGQVQDCDQVSASQEGGEGVVDRQGVTLTLQLEDAAISGRQHGLSLSLSLSVLLAVSCEGSEGTIYSALFAVKTQQKAGLLARVNKAETIHNYQSSE